MATRAARRRTTAHNDGPGRFDPFTRIGRFSIRNVQPGKLRFRVPLAAAVRAKLATRSAAAVTLRITLRDGSVSGVRTKQVTWRRPVRNPA